jgi:outer membrane biosynthesis protein TonB
MGLVSSHAAVITCVLKKTPDKENRVIKPILDKNSYQTPLLVQEAKVKRPPNKEKGLKNQYVKKKKISKKKKKKKKKTSAKNENADDQKQSKAKANPLNSILPNTSSTKSYAGYVADNVNHNGRKCRCSQLS